MRANRFFPFAAAALAMAIACASSGCKRKDGVVFKKTFSINLAIPDENWPGKSDKSLVLSQQEVYRLRGRPDYIRFWWRGRDEFATPLEVPAQVTPEIWGKVRQSWIYIRSKEEIIFDSPVAHHAVPISDKLRLVIEYGDPEERGFQPDGGGREVEWWHYYSTGYRYKFIDGKWDGKPVKMHDPMTGMMKR